MSETDKPNLQMQNDTQQEQSEKTNEQQNEEGNQKTSNENQKMNDSFANMKISDILGFDSQNELDMEKSEFKIQNFLKQQKKESEDLQLLQEKLMRDTLSLGLHKKKLPKQQLSTTDQSEEKNVNESKNFLFQKLEKKWGLDKITETEDEKEFMKDLLNNKAGTKPQTMQNEQNLPQSELDARERFLSQHMYQPSKRKNITEYNARYYHEIDPMMQGSHLDLKNEETPKMMRYMDEFREFKPQINIGERWGQIIQQSAINRIQYEQQIAKGGNLISYMAKTGKLGIDLYFIVFGVTATFIIPYLIFQHQKTKVNYIQKTKNINPQTVPDFYYSEYDLDEISVQKSFYNQYTEEIMEEKNKKLKLHKEISSLTNMLYKNK